MSDLVLLKNINDIDDDLVFEAENWKPRKARRLKIAVFAAAAVVAALLAFTGFEKSYKGDGKNIFEITNDDNVVVHSFYYNLKTWDITIPDEYKAYDKWGNLFGLKRLTGTLPSELFEKFGVSPLMNDNFSEDLDYEWRYDTFGYDDNGDMINVSDYGYPILSFSDYHIGFSYRLLDKNRQKIITLEATYPISDEYSIGNRVGIDNETDYGIIKLKDGSKCYVSKSGADFSYNGVLYNLTTYDSNEDWDTLSLTLTKQILKDLGVY